MTALPVMNWDGPDADPTRERRAFAGVVRAQLAAALDDAGRMLPLWTAFTRGDPLPAQQLTAVLGAPCVELGLTHGLLDVVDDGWIRSTVSIVAVSLGGELAWVASDFEWYDAEPAYVGGPGTATETLLAAVTLASSSPGRAIDVGTGSGAIAVALAKAGYATTATDVNPRALAYADLTATLNDVRVACLLLDLGEPPPHPADLVLCNPPFVLGNPHTATTFRDASDTGDTAYVARSLIRYCAPGGRIYFLANWPVVAGQPTADERVTEQLRSQAPGAAWLVVPRATVTVPQYARVWAEDDVVDEWVLRLQSAGISHVGAGIIVGTPREPGHSSVTVLADIPAEVADVAPQLNAWLGAGD